MRNHGHLINDGWVSDGTDQANVNPSDRTGENGLCSCGVIASVDGAIAAASPAQPGWADVTPQTRHDLLDAVDTVRALPK